jgi:N-acetylglutamate synthase-like GNAT family acetyltransferase
VLNKSTANGESDGPTLTFRRAAIDDYSTIRHVQSSAIRSLGDNLLDSDEVTAATSVIYSADYIADLAARNVHVAVLNGAIVGTCAWEPSDDRGSAARLSSLYVAPLSQRSGIGSGLVEIVSQDAAISGFSRMMATVPVSVVPMFAALGFTVASFGTSRDVIPDAALQVAFLRKP